MKATKENVKEMIKEKGEAGIEMIGFADENTNTENEGCDEEEYDGFCTFYHTNYNYPIEVTGEKLKEMSQDVCDYIFKLVYNGKKEIGLEGVNTARALSVCVAEAMHSLVEDMAEDLAEPEDWDCGDTPLSFKIGTVLEFPMDEDTGETKKGVVVGISAKDGIAMYSVFLGHTTLTIPAPMLFDMLGMNLYDDEE